MKRLRSAITRQYALEVVQCDCGFHLGVDASFLDQEDDFEIRCPSCQTVIRTKEVFPEEDLSYQKPTVKLSGESGNVFYIIGVTMKALQRCGAPQKVIDNYQAEATSGDYDHALQTTMKYVDVT